MQGTLDYELGYLDLSPASATHYVALCLSANKKIGF